MAFAADPVPVSAFIELHACDLPTMQAAVARVEWYGGTCTHLFPFRGCVGELPIGADKALSAEPEIAAVYRAALDAGALMQRDSALDVALLVWDRLVLNPPAEVSLAEGDQPAPPQDDALLPPGRPAAMEMAAEGMTSTPPDYYQTSEFLAGRVAVSIIMPESNGTIDANQEDWSTARQDAVVGEIAAALNWWAVREPAAGLSFTYRVERSVPTGYEPITRSQSQESLWIASVMASLGYPGTSIWTQTRNYVNALRDGYGTDWAFIAFVVDDLIDPDNMFAPNANGTKYFAYAYLGGPFMVMTYGNDGYGPGNMDAVMAHEMGHIFLAQDGYAASTHCTAMSGYLYVQNSNSLTPSQNACGMDMPCIMRGQVSPYTAGALSTSARGQLGWRDSDGDGILDPLDTAVGLSVWRTGLSEQGDGVIWNLAGVAMDYAYSSPSRADTTINTIQSVEYQVDGGIWRAVTSGDGAWDEPLEPFSFQTGLLSATMHQVNVRAINSVGNSFSYTVQLYPPGPHDIFLPFVVK